MLLADAAHAMGGKLYVLGGGWSIAGPGPTPMAIAMRFEVPWVDTDRRHDWELELIDGDGQPVLCAEHGDHAVRHHGHLHVHRPLGLPAGVPADVCVVVDAGIVSVPAGGRYVWRLSVNGETDEAWQVAFTTRAAEPDADEPEAGDDLG